MRISEVIVTLEAVREIHGDLPFVDIVDVDGRFLISENGVLDVVGLPEDDGTETLVCAYMEDVILPDEAGPSRKLKLVR